MESEAGSAPNGCTSTVKESEERHSLEHRDDDGSCISEIKLISNMVVKKKRGRRAPPSSRRLSGNKVISGEDTVHNCNHAKEEDQAGNSSDVALSPSSRKTEDQDQSTNPKDLFEKACHQATEMVTESTTGCKKSFWEEKGSDNRRGRQATLCVKQDGLDIETTGKDVSASEAYEKSSTLEDTSVGQAAAKSVNPEDNSLDPMDNVKVCDICGDVGEEERLAVCTRCNDGAEHIYCMRVMMEEVPEGEWLCEECENELEFEKKKKLEKSQLKVGASKIQFFERKTNKIANASKSNSYEEEASKAFEGRISKLDTALKNRSSFENEVDNENGDMKELNSTNQCNNSNSKRKEEGAGIISSIKQSITEHCGLSMGAESRKRLPLSRESSFRLDVEKGKQSTTKVPTSLAFDAAKNLGPPLRGQISKSTSFNNSKVPKVKQLVNEVPQKPNNLKDHLSFLTKKEGPVGILAKSPFFKKPKSCESANIAKSSILPPTEESKVMNPPVSHNVTSDRDTSILGCPSVTASMTTQVSSKEESKAQHLTTGYSEVNKQLVAKAPGSTTVSSAEKSSGILGSGAQRKIIQNTDPAHRDDKVKDPTSLRPGGSSINRTMRCQRCNEAGHFTQFCSVDKLSLSAVRPMSERNMKDFSAKRNKTCEVTNMIAAEKAASRPADQSEHILKCGPSHNPMCRPKDLLSTSFGHVKKPSQLYGRTNEQDMRSTSSNRVSTDSSKLKPNECQTVSVKTGRFVDGSFTMPDALMDKSNQVLLPGYGPKVSTVPELDFIWQGGFELRRTGRSPELCDGFQAHLSCSASPKVLEVAKKFPSKVQLEELPRQNSWPTQFQDNGPSYENIGLFFFARDTDSYENYYSKLVENMLKNDLALRGNIETAELLIFPSNILSKNFQRWNMFYFLWGVFRVRKKDQMNIPPDVPFSTCEPNLNTDRMDVDESISVLTSGPSVSEGQNNGAKSDHDLVKSVPCVDYQCPRSTETNYQRCSNGESKSSQPMSRNESEDHHHVPITASSSTNNSTDLVTEQQKLSCSGDEDTKDSSNSIACEAIIDINTVPVTCSVSSVHEIGKVIRVINLNEADNLVDVDINSSEVNSGTVDRILHTTATPHKRNVEVANWDDELNGKLEQKKIKLDNVGSANSSLSENTSDGRLSSKVHPLVSSSFDDSVDQSLAGSSKCNGKRVFPLDLNTVDPGNIVNISDDEEMSERDAPDLELELRDSKSPGKTMFSFLSPKVEENQNREHSLPTDTPGSLSLSLAFPASREHAGKLHSELPRQLPEMSSRNKISSIWDRQ
uniref:PHD-type domain-containing protein n=1 Tax=Oryza punctata TaxID=4537 RepID=A0A0E0MLY5_ORYPU